MLTDKIKDLRLQIDETARLCISPLDKPSNLMIRCQTELFMSKAWLGKLLGCYDVPTPYQNEGKRKEVKDIEPTADVKQPEALSKDVTPIEKIDILRGRIKDIADSIKNLELHRGTWEANVSRTNAFTHISQARFNLGFELERIREEAGKKK
jgi:hypothetical protein